MGGWRRHPRLHQCPPPCSFLYPSLSGYSTDVSASGGRQSSTPHCSLRLLPCFPFLLVQSVDPIQLLLPWHQCGYPRFRCLAGGRHGDAKRIPEPWRSKPGPMFVSPPRLLHRRCRFVGQRVSERYIVFALGIRVSGYTANPLFLISGRVSPLASPVSTPAQAVLLRSQPAVPRSGGSHRDRRVQCASSTCVLQTMIRRECQRKRERSRETMYVHPYHHSAHYLFAFLRLVVAKMEKNPVRW
mmetsp:Transcript_30363/g.60053  ORF Transcript_30363/g.60053 Transcript_30363/m.60053 type:complete len:242 (-) Transcript_30363:329-1054(-)